MRGCNRHARVQAACAGASGMRGAIRRVSPSTASVLRLITPGTTRPLWLNGGRPRI